MAFRTACGFPIRKLLLGTFLVTGSVSPAVAGIPTSKLVSGTGISPASAWTYYGTGTTHTNGPTAWTTRPPEIRELARTLSRSGSGAPVVTGDAYVARAVEYVRNNIEIEFSFGLTKGARGALIDQSGTAFDQAHLLVELLRENGATASYQVGTITLNATEFFNWTGFTNAKAACQFLADGGIPATINGQSACSSLSGNVTSAIVGHIWVQSNGKLYDPSYKRHVFKTGVDVAAAIGCGTAASPTCGTTLINATISGSLTGNFTSGVPYRKNLNETAVNNQLSTYAQAMENYIRSNIPLGELRDVIGGYAIDLTYSPTPGASLPYTSSAQYTWNNEIPDQFRSTLRVQYQAVDTTLYGDESSGRDLSIYHDATDSSNRKHLFLADNQLVQSMPWVSTIILTITVNHPHASGPFSDDTATFTLIDSLKPINIIHQWGKGSRSTPEHFAKLDLKPEPFSGSDPNSTLSCIGVSVPCVAPASSIGAQFAYLQGVSSRFVEQSQASRIVILHNVGMQSDFISIQTAKSVASLSDNATARQASFAASVSVDAAMEGIITSEAGHWLVGSAPSLIIEANRRSQRLLNVPTNKMANIIDDLPNYTNTSESALIAAAAEGYAFILPDNAYFGCTNTTPSGQICGLSRGEIGYKPDALSYLMDEKSKGGGIVGPTSPPENVASAIQKRAESIRSKKSLIFNPATADFSLAVTDIKTGTGAFPESLALTRTYSSAHSVAEALRMKWNGVSLVPDLSIISPDVVNNQSYMPVIGGGWVYDNFPILHMYNNPARSMGDDMLINASGMIAGVYALADVTKTSSFDARLAAVFIANWIGDITRDNEVEIRNGATKFSFARLPSGTFNPPAGHAARLVQSGNKSFGPTSQALYDYSSVAFSLTNRDGDVISFDVGILPNATANTWSFPSGVVVTYELISGTPSISNNLGRSLTLTYVPQNGNSWGWLLGTATDENGRQVTYARSNCPTFSVASGLYGTVTCSSLTVTGPDQNTTKMEYAPDVSSPIAADAIYRGFRLRRWFTPSDPNSAYLTFQYNRLDRAQSTKDARGNQTLYFPGRLFNETLARSEVVDSLAGVNGYSFDRFGEVLTTTNPVGKTTANTYDGWQRLIKTTYPEGDSVEYTYDVRSNRLTETQHPKPGSTLGDILFTTVYMEGPTVVTCVTPATCNKPSYQIDGRNYRTNFNWGSHGGMTTRTSGLQPDGTTCAIGSVCPVETYTYTPLGPSSIQFLTGKQERINPDNASITTLTSWSYNLSNKYVPKEEVRDSGGLSLRTCFGFDVVGNPISKTEPRAGLASCP